MRQQDRGWKGLQFRFGQRHRIGRDAGRPPGTCTVRGVLPALNLVLAVVLVSATSMLQAQASGNAAVEDAFRRGATAMRAGSTAEAEAAFREAVRLAPDLPDAHLDLGLVLAREGKLDAAIASVRQALTLNPKQPGAHMFLGIFLSQSNHQDEAEAALRQELGLDPKNVEALSWLGSVELAMSHPERATAPLDQAAELAPADLNVLEARARAHSLVAEQSYRQMAKVDPDSWQVHRVRGELDAEAGRHAEAITEFEAAIKQQARNPDLYEALGGEYRTLNQLDAAKTAYAKELELGPQNPIAMYELGSTEVELGDAKAGVPRLETMLKTFRDVPVAEFYLGRGLAALDRDAEALPWLEKSATDPNSGEVARRSYYELARIYRKLQRPTEAQHALAEYNRLRLEDDKRSGKQIEDWRKLSPAPPS